MSSSINAEHDDPSAIQELFSGLYADLHRLARRELARRGDALSLGTTTLLHEAYLDIAARYGPSFADQGRFMAYAARVMRGLIIDYARTRHATKRGGEFHITSLASLTSDAEDAGAVVNATELEAISDALDALAREDEALAQIVDLKFFCGFSFVEIAAMQQTSERTVQRKWEKARIYLHRSLRTAPQF